MYKVFAKIGNLQCFLGWPAAIKLCRIFILCFSFTSVCGAGGSGTDDICTYYNITSTTRHGERFDRYAVLYNAKRVSPSTVSRAYRRHCDNLCVIIKL